MAAGTAMTANAQMDNVVSVETTYTPTVQEAKKIDVLPQAETTRIKHYDVEYSLDAAPAGQYVFEPADVQMSDAVIAGAPKGFFTAAGGNNCNLLTRGAYGWDLSDRSSLNFDLGLRGHSGDVDLFKNDSKTWHQRFYTTQGMVKFEHRLSPLSSLIIRADGESQVYNYQHNRGSEDYDKQHNMIGGIDVSVTPYTTGIFTVGGHTRAKLFSRRCLLSPTTWELGDDKYDMTQHTWDLGLTTDLRISEQCKAGVDLNYQNIGWSDGGYASLYAFDVIPHFTVKNEKTYVRLGARLTFENGTELEYVLGENTTHNKFKVAPDVYAAFHLNPRLDFFGEATGGVVMNDFWLFQSLSPYWQLPFTQLQSGYNNICAKAGFKWNVIEGLYTKIYAGFDDTKNRAELMMPNGKLYQTPVMVADGSLVHFNLEASYDWQDKINVTAKGRFNGWAIDDNNGYYLDTPAWRPTVEASAAVTFQPISGLRIGVDYQFATFDDDSGVSYDRPTMSNLGASVSYKLPASTRLNNLSIYAKLDNLLGCDYDWYYGHQAMGTSVLAGFALTF